jgi:hypothetical protein
MPSVMRHYYSTEEHGENTTQIQQLKYPKRQISENCMLLKGETKAQNLIE